MQATKIKRVSAGEVLTASLLKKVNKAAYQFGGLEVEGTRSFAIVEGKAVRTLPTVKLEKRYITGDIVKFKEAFTKTMNSSVYNLEII